MEIDKDLYHTKVTVKTDHPSLVNQLNELSVAERARADKVISRFKERAEQRTWQQLIRSGSRPEKLRRKKNQQELWSVRFSKKGRLLVFPESGQLVIYSIHPDHDSAYG